ncbi:hypothetical protein Tsubulata_039135 [Turnera subulata]|uniref:Uncharacterized protein n=1 Tax=Turnera subulata TaxID=218843 RepID=A0A9Q0F358_9ROSI|nr:hypothetical protein Tsubulata_039135 [Turnera subulata]
MSILPLLCSRTSFNRNEPPARRGGLVLQFVNKSASTIFTGSRVEAEDGNPLRVVLLDPNTKTLISSGPLSSLKIEIVVLDGDFGSDDQDDWSEGEFNANVIREREGRRPLVTGELTIVLKDGVGHLSDIVFTDNSSWQRSRRFRLGVRALLKNSEELRIREGRSEAFVVKDHRGELYKKHHPPHLRDDIWRLERIAKDGAFHKRLASCGILTVEEFLQAYAIDPSALRNMLGCGISNRIWETILEHAKTCVLDDRKFYTFYDAKQGLGLLFNVVYKVVGATFDSQNYEPLHNLNPPQKALVENLKRQAYKNVKDLILVDASSVFAPSSRNLASLPAEPFDTSNLALQQFDFPVTRQDQPELQLDYNNSSSSTSYGYEAESSSQPEVSVHQILRNSFKFLDHIPTPFNGGGNSWPQNGWSAGTSGPFNGNEISEAATTTIWSPGNSPRGQGSAFIFTSSGDPELGFHASLPGLNVHMSRMIRKPKVGWCKLRAALVLDSVRREVAARRYWQDFCV